MNSLQVFVETDNRPSGPLAPPCKTGISIRSVANKPEIVRNGHWRDAELFTDPSFIPDLSRSAIQLDYAIVFHALCQVLVGGADVNTGHCRDSAKRQRCTGESVVRLQFDHRPDYNSHVFERLLKQRELCEQARIDPLTRLVPRPEIVAEGLDHVIGRDADVRNSRFKHPSNTSQHSPRRRDLLTPPARMRRHSVEVAKKLVGAIDEVDFQLSCPKIRFSSIRGVLREKP